MSAAYVSQIQAYGFNFAPRNWALCNGQILSIQQNTALFSLLGTTYGGNGVTTFSLPNLQSRVPMHEGNGFDLGEVGGVEMVTLTMSNLPIHTHQFSGSSQLANSAKPSDGTSLAATSSGGNPGGAFYGAPSPARTLNPESVIMVGGNQPHTNLQPYLAINWCICQYGIYPSRN